MITARFRCSLSNSMRKVTHPPAGPCVGNRCHCRHFQRGPPGLGTVPTRRLRYNYVCDPTQMPLGVTEAITSFLYGVGGVASELWPPTPSFLGSLREGKAFRGHRLGWEEGSSFLPPQSVCPAHAPSDVEGWRGWSEQLQTGVGHDETKCQLCPRSVV